LTRPSTSSFPILCTRKRGPRIKPACWRGSQPISRRRKATARHAAGAQTSNQQSEKLVGAHSPQDAGAIPPAALLLAASANCRCSRRSKAQSSQNRWNPNRQDQMAMRGLLGGALFMTVGAIVPAGAQTPPSSSPPQAPGGFQVPGKTPQERCYYRYRTAHNYNHVGPKAMAACPDPNQEQPNPD
jgi:hypothetical protein